MSVPDDDTTCVVKLELLPPPCSACNTSAKSNILASNLLYLLSGLNIYKIFSAVDNVVLGVCIIRLSSLW